MYKDVFETLLNFQSRFLCTVCICDPVSGNKIYKDSGVQKCPLRRQDYVWNSRKINRWLWRGG